MIAPDATPVNLQILAGLMLVPALAAVALVIVLARFALPLGLLDEGGGAGLHRAQKSAGVRLVGGLAFAAALALCAWIAADPSAQLSSQRSAPWPGIAMFSGLVIGLADDSSHAGLSARVKLALQALPALAFALGNDTPLGWFPLAFVAALAAQNLANTYDNADGVLLATAAIAFAPARPAWSAIAVAVLAFNVRIRGRANVLLGDSGSHLIALLLLCEPRAWGAFVVPTLDLARVAIVRRSQGRPVSLGDRTHLAHRLQARGLGAAWIVVVLSLSALPAIMSVAYCDGALQKMIGILGSVIAFLLVVRATPALDGHGARLTGARCDSPPADVDRAR